MCTYEGFERQSHVVLSVCLNWSRIFQSGRGYVVRVEDGLSARRSLESAQLHQALDHMINTAKSLSDLWCSYLYKISVAYFSLARPWLLFMTTATSFLASVTPAGGVPPLCNSSKCAWYSALSRTRRPFWSPIKQPCILNHSDSREIKIEHILHGSSHTHTIWFEYLKR